MNNKEIEKEIKEIKAWVEEIRAIMWLDKTRIKYNPQFLCTIGIDKNGKAVLG
jgi:hypothetical protein